MVRVIVEGNDDKKFIIKILNHLKEHNEITIKDKNLNSYIEIMGQ